jgi:ribosomal protein S20
MSENTQRKKRAKQFVIYVNHSGEITPEVKSLVKKVTHALHKEERDADEVSETFGVKAIQFGGFGSQLNIISSNKETMDPELIAKMAPLD